MVKKLTIWFDLVLTYEELQELERLRGKQTQMEYVMEALRERLKKDAEEKRR